MFTISELLQVAIAAVLLFSAGYLVASVLYQRGR